MVISGMMPFLIHKKTKDSANHTVRKTKDFYFPEAFRRLFCLFLRFFYDVSFPPLLYSPEDRADSGSELLLREVSCLQADLYSRTYGISYIWTDVNK